MKHACEARYVVSEADADRWFEERQTIELTEDDERECGLPNGHEGLHVADAAFFNDVQIYRDEVELGCEDDAPWWIAWEGGTPAQILEGTRCPDCTLPTGHLEGAGCTAPVELRCESAVELNADEVERLNGMPGASDEVDPSVRCWLEPNHDGSHSCYVQGVGDDVLWWVVWETPEAHCVMTAPGCGLQVEGEDEENTCLLLAGHGGAHRGL